MASAGGSKTLEFHSSIVNAEDVALLEPGEWFNDALLTFAMEYCAHVTGSGREGWEFVHPG